MSPVARTKSKDKKAGKEPPKGSPKPSGHANTSVGIPASGYNPLLGTFHTFETAPVPSPSPLHINGRFRNIDDTDDHNGNGIEYDSVSNNDSWSGESEDHKEKTSQSQSRQESVPGADNDKREKIRQKNEKKHQRQKERRAQELHEKCSGYLMSRKLEALAQQLVSMGFSQERATMALILNEGRVEESVSWLFEGGEEDNNNKRTEHSNNNLDGGGNLKIDISEELARITEMEIRYKSSKQEVERAVVACEGDLDKAEETLKMQKQESTTPPASASAFVFSKPEETSDHHPTVIVANGKLPIEVQAKPTIIQQKRDDKDLNYTTTTRAPTPTIGMQPLKKQLQPPNPQQIPVPAEKRWPGLSGPNPSPPQTKIEAARFLAVGNELRNLQLGSVVREPVVVMQRPQSVNNPKPPNVNVATSSPPGTAVGWYPDTVKPPPVAVSRSLSPNDFGGQFLYNNQVRYQSQQQQFVSSSSGNSNSSSNGNSNSLWARGGLSAASSLGLFSGLGVGSSGSMSPSVDWSTGGSELQCDYTNIDWSLNLGSLTRPSGNNKSYSLQNNNNGHGYDSYGSYYGLGVNSVGMRLNGNGVAGLQEGGSTEGNGGGGGGSREWTSPFEERDIFSLPRQFVSSPSL